MPQLISHRDGFGWQTPNVTDILEAADRASTSTGELRTNATLMVRRLAELGTPVRLKQVEDFRSHTRFHLIPDKAGARGAEHLVTIEDLKVTLPRIMTELNIQTWELVKLRPNDLTITLFLRTPTHQPLRLRDLMQQQPFLESADYTTLLYGADLQHRPLTLRLAEDKNMLILGSSHARLHAQVGTALTLMLFNSPSYLRLALVGDETSLFRRMASGPHTLGNILPSAADFRRLLDGLLKHVAQRRRLFEKNLVTSLDEYNKQAISNKDMKPMPRIVIMLDTVVLPDWRSKQGDWLVPLHQILTRGGDYGVNVVMTAPDEYSLPERIMNVFSHYVVMRSALAQTPDRQAALRNIPVKFIDALLIESDSDPSPVELAAVSEAEIARAVTYWQNMKNRRDTAIETTSGQAPTGNTGLLSLRDDMQPAPSIADGTKADLAEYPIIPDRTVASAQALASYLGWLGVGPLHDILGLTQDEALETLRILRAISVLEPGDGPTYRFVRLADLPE